MSKKQSLFEWVALHGVKKLVLDGKEYEEEAKEESMFKVSGLDEGETEMKGEEEEEGYTKTGFVRRCRVCGKTFSTVTEHREHFSSEEHLRNIGVDITEGSDSDQSDEPSSSSSRESSDTEEEMKQRNCLVSIQGTDGEECCAYRCVVEALGGVMSGKSYVSPSDFFNEFRRNVTKPDNHIWCIAIQRSGKFAGGVYKDGVCVSHKVLHKYANRKKQGGSQATADSTHSRIRSVGAQLRRAGQKALEDESKVTMKEWRETHEFDVKCDVVALVVPRGKKPQYLCSKGMALEGMDPHKLIGIPMTTSSPTYAEVQRVFNELWFIKDIHESV